jgi:tetratricopeptide (TPR) repeat protein
VLRRGHLHLVAALVLAACGGLGDVGTNTDTDTAPYARILDGDGLVTAGDGPAAERLFKELLKDHPTSLTAHRGLQDARRIQATVDEYERRYRTPTESPAPSSLDWYLYGRAVIASPADASAAFEKALELDRTNAWAVAGLAYLSYRRGDVYDVVQQYEAGVARAPRSATMRRLLGNQYLELKLYIHAQRHLDIAFALAPRDLEIRAARGKALLALQDEEAALRILEAVHDEEPRIQHIVPSLGALYLRLGCPQPADELYREGLRHGMAPDDQLAAEIRAGLVLEGLGRHSCTLD